MWRLMYTSWFHPQIPWEQKLCRWQGFWSQGTGSAVRPGVSTDNKEVCGLSFRVKFKIPPKATHAHIFWKIKDWRTFSPEQPCRVGLLLGTISLSSYMQSLILHLHSGLICFGDSFSYATLCPPNPNSVFTKISVLTKSHVTHLCH